DLHMRAGLILLILMGYIAALAMNLLRRSIHRERYRTLPAIVTALTCAGVFACLALTYLEYRHTALALAAALIGGGVLTRAAARGAHSAVKRALFAVWCVAGIPLLYLLFVQGVL